MKINKPHIPAINPYQKNDLKMKQTPKQQVFQQDKIEISSKAKELSEMTSYATERNEHIQKIKEQVQSGNYEVNPEKIAKSLLAYYQ